MKLRNREKDLLEALSATTKSALSIVPGLGQAIAGWDAYKRSAYDRNVLKVIEGLSERLEDIEGFFQQDYFKTNEGQQFARKVFDSAFDIQLEDKQELFLNALINGTRNISLSELEKLKFIDILRHLSRASLMILSEIHKMFIDQVRGPGRHPNLTSSYPLVNAISIAEKLSDKYNPYLVTSSISEMQSQGLFCNIGEWRKDINSGKQLSGGGFASELCYTDFAARFVDFIKFISTKNITSKN